MAKDDGDNRAIKKVTLVIKHVMWILGIGFGITLLTNTSSRAAGFKFLGVLLLVIGITLFVLSFVSCVTFNRDEDCFFYEVVFCAVPLYLLMVALGIFMFAVSVPGSGKSIPGIEYKEYELRSYSKWMQNKVNVTYRWDKYYKPTLVKNHVCSDMLTKFKFDTLDQFHKRSLSSFELGCCKPLEECKLNYTSQTVWRKPEIKNYTNTDCYNWSNDPTTLCFNCQSCKGAFVQYVKHHWYIPGLIIVIVIVIATIVIGCFIYARWCR